MAALAVTAIGADRPGIVAAVAGVLHDHGANIEDSAMTILGGHFAVVMLVDVDADADAIEEALIEATTDLGLTVHVSGAEGGTESPDPTHLLSVYGPDRTGIMAGVTAALADAGANVTDLETRLLGQGGDEPVYAMVIELVAPDPESHDRIVAAVAETCAALGVDHTLRRIESETY